MRRLRRAFEASCRRLPSVADLGRGFVVLHEGIGLNDDVRRHAERFAAAGYLVVAVDLYTAGGALRCLLATFRALVRRQGPAFEDIDAARRWLAARHDCTGRVGVVGFCMGGGFALLAAARGFDASAPNYPALTNWLPREALRGACPIVASYGGPLLGTGYHRQAIRPAPRTRTTLPPVTAGAQVGAV